MPLISRRVRFDARTIGFVDHEDIGDLHHSRFDGLNFIPMPGTRTTTVRPHAADIDLVLADPDRFDDDEIESRGAEKARERALVSATSTGCAACGHGADEYTGVGMVTLHAHAVAQVRSAGGSAGGIDREDGNRFSAMPHFQQ